MSTGNLTEQALAKILKTTDITDLLKSQEENKKLTEAQKARERQGDIARYISLGEENYALDKAAQTKRKAAVDRATAPTTEETLENFQKEIQ